jgi:hypothetical protein
MATANVDPTEIDFETYVKMYQGKGFDRQDYPGITVGTKRWGSVYINAEAKELVSGHNKDQFIAAPNPDAPGQKEFFFCKTVDGSGYTSAASGSGLTLSRSVITNMGEAFEAAFKYKLEETGMTHPNWGTPIFLGIPKKKHDGRSVDYHASSRGAAPHNKTKIG